MHACTIPGGIKTAPQILLLIAVSFVIAGLACLLILVFVVVARAAAPANENEGVDVDIGDRNSGSTVGLTSG